jgi:hypothetical protein
MLAETLRDPVVVAAPFFVWDRLFGTFADEAHPGWRPPAEPARAP